MKIDSPVSDCSWGTGTSLTSQCGEHLFLPNCASCPSHASEDPCSPPTIQGWLEQHPPITPGVGRSISYLVKPWALRFTNLLSPNLFLRPLLYPAPLLGWTCSSTKDSLSRGHVWIHAPPDGSGILASASNPSNRLQPILLPLPVCYN